MQLNQLHMGSSCAITRPEQLKEIYVDLIDKHLDDLLHNRADKMYEIEDFAALMFVHPTHLSNTMNQLTGISPCGIYQHRILDVAKYQIINTDQTIREIAFKLTFEPSQFSKWFKKHIGVTPLEYRKQQILRPA